MLQGALATPVRSADAAGTLVVGSVLTFLAWVVTPVWLVIVAFVPPVALAAPLALAPAFVARGYFIRVVSRGIETENTEGAPPFVRWGGLYRDGVKSVLLTAGYLLPLIVVLGGVALAGVLVESGRVDLALVADPVLGGGWADPAVATPVVGVGGGLVFLSTAVYLLVFMYLRPAALSTFAATGRLRDAFRPSLVVPVARSGEYAVGWTLAVLVLITGYTFAIPLVPFLIGIGLVFATRVVAHTLYGRGAADVLNDRPTTSTGSSERTDETGENGADRTDDGTDEPRNDEWVSSDADHDERLPARPGRVSRGEFVLAEAPVDVQIGRSVPPTPVAQESSEADASDRPVGRDDGFFAAEPEAADGSAVLGDDHDPTDGVDSDQDSDGDHTRDSDAADGFDWGPRTDG